MSAPTSNLPNQTLHDDYEIPYTANERTFPELADGRYVALIKSVSHGTQKAGKYAGSSQLIWEMEITNGEFAGNRFRCSTLLEPEHMVYTTDRLIKAAFPSIQKGNNPKVKEMVGCTLECEIKTFLANSGRQSMYVDLKNVFPYVSPGAVGNTGEFDPNFDKGDPYL